MGNYAPEYDSRDGSPYSDIIKTATTTVHKAVVDVKENESWESL